MRYRYQILAFLLFLAAYCCGRESEASASKRDADRSFAVTAAMLSLANPGVSAGSRVPCDNEACGWGSWVDDSFAPREDFRFGRWQFEGWSRQESPDEALDRWIEAADAIRKVARASADERWWNGNPNEMATLLVTVARHESAFWRSVQDGTIRGPAGEMCYLQIHPAVAEQFGIEPAEILGLDQEATFACFWHGAKMLAAARNACAGSGGHWSLGTISMYGSGQHCAHRGDWVLSRGRSYARAAAALTHPQRFARHRARVSVVLGADR